MDHSAGSTILFAGGGTGGHLFPGIAVAQELQRQQPATQCVFVGSGRTLEQPVVTSRGFAYRTLPAEPLQQLWRRPWRFVWRNWQALRGADRLLQEFQPAAVIGLGGYASAPVVTRAHRRGVPTILLEQNSVPGRATRWLSRRADVVCLSYAESVAAFSCSVRTVLTGNPVRQDIAEWVQSQAEPSPPALLILGGSQGAQALNAAVPLALDALRPLLSGWNIRHQVGSGNTEQWQAEYERLGLTVQVEPFITDMRDAYAQATIVISRAGATTLAELTCAGLPSILVPYPQAVDDHQRKNAQSLVAAGAAVLAEQQANPAQTAAVLGATLREWITDPDQRRRVAAAARQLAAPQAATEVCRLIHSVIDERRR